MRAAERHVIDRVRPTVWIAGEWRGAATGATFPVEDPSTGTVLAEVADANAEDALAALGAAAAVQSEWATRPPRERSDILRRAFELVVSRRDELAVLITLEMGKPLMESANEVDYSADFLRWFSEEALRIGGRYATTPDGMGRMLTMSQPVGPCLFITPWNFPLAMGARKVAPAVAAGCTMVVKPAPQTPLTMLALAAILEEAGLPPGVMNVVPTTAPDAVAGPMLADPRLRKLSFTGSTRVGRHLLAAAGEGVLRTSMELGGNAPLLVFEDADLDEAVAGAVVAKMRNMGQACTAANRFYVHAAVAERFTQALHQRMAALKVGRGVESGTDVGPLIDSTAREKVAALVRDANDAGARVLTCAEPADGPGYFFPPTVLADVPANARVMHEEIFGPVAPISTFTCEDEAIEAANATEYGLVAYAFTKDIERAFRVVERLDVGMVGLNSGKVSNAAAPFGGVKHSGIGREGGPEGIGEFLETKYVAIPAYASMA